MLLFVEFENRLKGATKNAILNLKHVFPKSANFEATLYSKFFDWIAISSFLVAKTTKKS